MDINTSSSSIKQEQNGQSVFSAPTISLPKGGGAIRGMGEKFAANPVTGTGSMTVPIAVSPGRSGFGPQLNLSYDSGSGNGPFGFGWSLSLPSITRKTDKGLPRYFDIEDDSDVFLLSGAEDLVPIYRKDADGTWVASHAGYQRDSDGLWVLDSSGHPIVYEDEIDGYRVRRYRPRIEGLFARIERWSKIGVSDDIHWRSISKDNIITLYGLDANSRISDPLDASHIFTWLICETRDDKGNAILYRYKAENGLGIDVAKSHEHNRGVPGDPRRTAYRYIKSIHYGNRTPLLDNIGQRPRFINKVQVDAQITDANWMFEVVFDYGEHDQAAPKPNDTGSWTYRIDPFSSYRSGFEVRITRLCQRVLMFHHFPDEIQIGRNCLIRSTDFIYSNELDPVDVRNPVYTFLQSSTQTSYRRIDEGYDQASLPPIEFEYTQPMVQEVVEQVDSESIENIPIGLDGSIYRWIDLHGEGIPGIMCEQASDWYYKRNLSPIPEKLSDGREQVKVRFAPLETVVCKPNVTLSAGADIMDMAGDGQPDVVIMNGATPGLYEHDQAEGWQFFRPFTSRLNRDLHDPNVKLIDIDGDGHIDLLITENDVLIWHESLAEEGFGPAQHVAQALDEEKGPRIVFADSTESIHLADLSGDGLTDIIRIRNSEICYWPNLGYGHFGSKVAMDNAPRFDYPDQFDQKRIRLADIDGSGTTDIIYLHREGVRLYFNQCGNGWSQPVVLKIYPRIDDIVSIMPIDLLGNGTACLVWSSPLPADSQQPMRYVNLMGGNKPHLLVKTFNNLGAETRITYAPSTKFYLKDKLDGKPWITRLPFPVHVVERIETYDYISRNRFTTRYAYHHGYFDGEEREFRGFGMVEQWDTEQFATLTTAGTFPQADNITSESHVPPIHTKTWFHTGVYINHDHVSDYFAGLLGATDQGEYFREPGLTDAEVRALLLQDTMLPAGLTLEEEREACRALKGLMLRQEVYAEDAGPGASADQIQRASTPYTVTEQNFNIRILQLRGRNRHAVFFTHACEALNYHYERNSADPRIQHTLTLDVDACGNVLKEASIGYGRRAMIRNVDAEGQVQQVSNPDLAQLHAIDQVNQTTTLLTYTENHVTNAIETTDNYRNPLPCETITFELTGYAPTGSAGRFQTLDLIEPDPASLGSLRHKFTTEIAYEAKAIGNQRRRPIEHVRSLYRKNNLTALLPLGELDPLGLVGESYKLAFTPGLLSQVFQRPHQGQPTELLLPNPAAVVGGQAGNRGGYLSSQTLKADGRFPASDPDDHWWIPSGQSFFSANEADSALAEWTQARQHFFLSHRYRDPFGQNAFVTFDANNLLMTETRDALGNRITVDANDYRVLQPCLISDPNHNRTEVVFDILGMVAGTAVMGKPLPALVEGDTLAGFTVDMTQAQLDDFFDGISPHTHAVALLKDATTRIVYDLNRFRRTRQANPNDPTQWQPVCAATLARETHASTPLPPQGLKIQISFSYSDGFGREIQKKLQAEPEKVNGVAGPPRWVGSGWTIFNNKGKPVRQYESFFSPTHHFEFGVQVGVSPVLFYDPAERVIATLHPNHTFEKVVFNPWQQTTYDVNDTCAPRNAQTGDPRSDPDISGYMVPYFAGLPASPPAPAWQTWRAQRIAGAFGVHEQAAAVRATAHADTPTTVHFDVLGRPFLTVARNRVVCAGHDRDGTEESYYTRVELDIEGNQRAVRDAIEQAGDTLGRIVMRYDYDMLGNRIHQLSMEAGARWMLNDVAGKPIRAWDSRGHNFVTAYDVLRRPVEQYVRGTTTDSDPRTLNRDILVDKIEYGEGLANAERFNLRTRIYRHFDPAGVVTNARLDSESGPVEAYDFKGNLLGSTRRLVRDYTSAPDWLLNPSLDNETFESSTRYDALNRPTQSIAPHSSLARAKRNVIQPFFNEANLLERMDVWLERATEPVALLNPVADAPSLVGVANIDYDAKGQRQRIDYKNGASTFYDYDPLTLRLTHLYTRRGAAFTEDCDNPSPPPPTISAPDNPPPGESCGLQNLYYTYDPTGNITHIQDDAQQTLYFRNRRVEPSNDYTYDALYRLIQASGRQHLGQIGGAPIPHSHNDADRVGLLSADAAGRFSANDGNAMGAYVERYVYDAVGNFVSMQHRGSDPAHPGWTRGYTYAETSLIENGSGGALLKTSNRLSRTQVHPNGDSSLPEAYQHDAHGNMVFMPHLGNGLSGPNMRWDYKDQLRETDLGGGGAAFYVYDASGQRVRKVWEKSLGRVEERIYLGGFEIFRKHNGPIGSGSTTLERETLHIMDDKQRIALVEMRTLDTAGEDTAPRQLMRYQFGNHLGSASLELDEQAQIISYEEYAPYGSSTYQAVRSQTETAKRYRYTGKERDDESGLYYHGARYYAAWLGKWISPDPGGLIDGSNQYRYARNNPARLSDTTGYQGEEAPPRERSWGAAIGGFLAGVVVGVIVGTVASGFLSPVGGAMVAGAVGGMASELAESWIDGRPVSAERVITAGVIGGVTGGALAGATQALRQPLTNLANRALSTAAGRGVAGAAYRVATTSAGRAVAQGAERASGVLRGAGEEVGLALERRLGPQVGRQFGNQARQSAAERAQLAEARALAQTRQAAARDPGRGVSAARVGEVDNQPVADATSSGRNAQPAGEPRGAVAVFPGEGPPVIVPPANQGANVGLDPFDIGGRVGVRSADAEIRLFGQTLGTTAPQSTGTLYLGVTAPMCPSCTSGLWTVRDLRPNLRLVTDTPWSVPNVSGAVGGGAGSLSPHNEPPPVVPVLEVTF